MSRFGQFNRAPHAPKPLAERMASMRRRTFDDRRWGSITNAEASAAAISGAHPTGIPLNLTTGGHIVDVAIWPPRIVTPLLVFTPADLPTWTADGATFLLTWTLGIGIGSTTQNVLVEALFAPPYAQVVLPATPLQLPVRRLTITGAITGMPNSVPVTLFQGRFFAAAAPWSLAGLGGEDLDEGGTHG